MYFELEVDHYSNNEANKNKCKNFQLIASTKSSLADKQIVQGNWPGPHSILLLGLVVA